MKYCFTQFHEMEVCQKRRKQDMVYCFSQNVINLQLKRVHTCDLGMNVPGFGGYKVLESDFFFVHE